MPLPTDAVSDADVLIFAMEAGRFGPARLPQNLAAVGLAVATLCPSDNALAATDWARLRFDLPRTRSGPRLARALARAIVASGPRLVIPGDEQAVVLLHAFTRGYCADILGVEALDTIVRSLGRTDRLGATLFKSETLALARQIGVRVPAGGTARFPGEALHIAQSLGYPVYVKRSFGWSGDGVTRCETPGAVLAALATPRGMRQRIKTLARQVLGRDWYPQHTAIDVQGVVAGKPAMYCALAWQGRLVGGFAGEALATTSETGPSCEVRVGAHKGMEQASARMIEALGCTGWIGFDFMLEEGSGEAILLECNPRPIQVSHVGYRIGADLAAELARLLRGGAVGDVPLAPDRDLDLVLFPFALDPSRQRVGALGDLPGADAGLMSFGRALGAPVGPSWFTRLRAMLKGGYAARA